MRRGILAAFLLLIVGISGYAFYLRSLAPTEQYPTDTYLAQVPSAARRALILVAHDDDAVAFAGTISRLTQAGWQVAEVCFYVPDSGDGDTVAWQARNASRQQGLRQVGRIEGLRDVRPLTLAYRTDLDTVKMPWMPMPYTQMAARFRLDSLRRYVGQSIARWQPTVIFTLDDIVGGYGHPDHVVISQLVRAACAAGRDQPPFPVRLIYQGVFAPSQAERVMGQLPAYQAAKHVYGVPGLPAPTTQVVITPWAAQKKAVLRAYPTEQHVFRQFWPGYRWWPASVYYRLNEREFFRVLTAAQW